jgi:uncharacterized protein
MTEITTDTRVLRAVAEHPYPLAFATISGAHLYGFASPDSDVDIRGVHLLPLERLVGLTPGPETVERSDVLDGLEIDLVTHDLRKFIALMVKPNGYVLEQLLSPLVVASSPLHQELRALAPACLTRHHADHYLGFAASQWALFEKDEPRRVKPLLYVYRVLLTGLHLMATGVIEANLEILAREAGLAEVLELIGLKRTGAERGTLPEGDLEHHVRRYGELRAALEQARETTHLPERADAREALDALLVRSRLAGAAGATR